MFDALSPGGILYFRDYARYDLAQLRFKHRSKIGENLYVRQDSTTSYFFELEEFKSLVLAVGFKVDYCLYYKKEKFMAQQTTQLHRRWLQAKCIKPL
jgi:methyltransferase-like protein 6